MNYAACGPPNCPIKEPLNKHAIEISFKLLKYHRDSNRSLTFQEYEQIRHKYWYLENIHESLLYILEDGTFSVLMKVSGTGRDVGVLCNLKWLFETDSDSDESVF